jgi:NAD+ diphosphatase
MNEAFFKSPRGSFGFGFAVNPLDRVSEKREDEAFLTAQRARPDARALVLCRDTPIIRKRAEGLDPLFPLSEIDSFGATRQSALLGLLPGGAPVFAILLEDKAVELRSDASDGFLDRRVMVVPGRADLALIDMRSIAVQGLLAPDLIGMFGQAKALMHWHMRHSHCANCGAVTRVTAAGWRRECDVCKAQHFPRTDPVVIMLAVDGDNCLLGRQARFPKAMYSCLAGFLESGETIEDAVRREILEEAGIKCGPVAYLASQPWPHRRGDDARIACRRRRTRGCPLVLARRGGVHAARAPSRQTAGAASHGDRASYLAGLGGGIGGAAPSLLCRFTISLIGSPIWEDVQDARQQLREVYRPC